MNTISGGDGGDTFILEEVSEYTEILDFEAGQDIIKIDQGISAQSQHVDNDTVFNSSFDYLGIVYNAHLLDLGGGFWG
ncbi:hypothetical protein PMIT1313_00813 [Prochlorococcus marinus str. MIT 1313]|uniref:hypothetical protein n=1 Tax=Prochlorococcus TaxID=1218 RepID=UPI0007B370DD|nr:hypothetical protein [Prochlorococcus marinus]KZR70162.1 hypothetical protein PMIT1313_00813 [Prochlorococcus marinus str. MIT 1313]KZR72885.1 hypothetical protein PMIT1318_00852 [Prochlorococcus marinus str. MIT 1318]